MNSELLNMVLLPGVDIEIKIEARLLWREQTSTELESLRRQEASNFVRGLGQDLERPMKEILSQIIYQRAQIDG